MVRMNQAALPTMRTQGQGRIVMFSSINGLMGIPFQSAYTASKHAVEGYAECLAMEVRPFGVQVCLVEPGDHRSGSGRYRLQASAMGDASLMRRISAGDSGPSRTRPTLRPGCAGPEGGRAAFAKGMPCAMHRQPRPGCPAPMTGCCREASAADPQVLSGKAAQENALSDWSAGENSFSYIKHLSFGPNARIMDMDPSGSGWYE